VRRVSPDRVRVGLDPFAAFLIGHPMSVIVSPVGTLVKKDTPGCWLLDESGTIPVKIPVTGRVARFNDQLTVWPGLLTSDPYEEGWLLEATVTESGALDGLLDASSMERRTEEDWRRIERRVTEALVTEAPGVGPVLADGGEPVTDLRRILGPRRHRLLVLELM
jgi:glycine cleavage system H protein